MPTARTEADEPLFPGYLCYEIHDGREVALWSKAASVWMKRAWKDCGPAVEARE